MQVTDECHSHFDKEKESDETIVQQAAPHINFGDVSNVLRCSVRVF
jgi:hypothetical protein